MTSGRYRGDRGGRGGRVVEKILWGGLNDWLSCIEKGLNIYFMQAIGFEQNQKSNISRINNSRHADKMDVSRIY